MYIFKRITKMYCNNRKAKNNNNNKMNYNDPITIDGLKKNT